MRAEGAEGAEGAGEGRGRAEGAGGAGEQKKLDMRFHSYILGASVGNGSLSTTLTIEKEKRNDKVRSLRF